MLPVCDGLGVAHAVPEQLLHPRPALAQDAEPRQPRPRGSCVAPVIRHHALTLVLLGSLELISEVISVDEPHLDEAVCESHPEVVLAVLGRGVDQPSARRASDVQPGQQRARDTTITNTIIIIIVTGEGPSPGTKQTAQY